MLDSIWQLKYLNSLFQIEDSVHNLLYFGEFNICNYTLLCDIIF